MNGPNMKHATAPQAPVSYSPNPGDTLIFENDRVRVWSMTLPPHGVYEWHQHHFDHLILWPMPGTARIQRIDDEDWTIRQEAHAGFTIFKTIGSSEPLKPHRIQSLVDHEVTHYIVELISEPSPSAIELREQFNDRGAATLIATGEPA